MSDALTLPSPRSTVVREEPILIVTGSPPDVHCDPAEMILQEAPSWHLRSRCEQCHVKFGYFTNKRHHCRNCGKSVCGAHSTGRVVLLHMKYMVPERVCDGCHKAYMGASENYAQYVEERLQSIFT